MKPNHKHNRSKKSPERGSAMSRKTKIYLDTSVNSHLEQQEKPSEQEHSHMLLKKISEGQYTAHMSATVIDELMASPHTKRDILLWHVSGMEFVHVPLDYEVMKLAQKIISRNVLPPSSANDSQHIAAAVIAGCDYLVSWNMRHMANVRTNKGMLIIALEEGFKEIMIVPPSMLSEERGALV